MDDRNLGVIEDIVRETRFMDAAKKRFDRVARNAPVSPLPYTRRKFFRLAASVIGTGMVAACQSKWGPDVAVKREPSKDGTNERLNPDWKEFLLGQDLMYGPKLTFFPGMGGYQGHEQHIAHRTLLPIPNGGVDYDVPIGTPIVPDRDGYAIFGTDIHGSKFASILHSAPSRVRGSSDYEYTLTASRHITINGHLNSFSDHVKLFTRNFGRSSQASGSFPRIRLLGYSGNTGPNPLDHLHMHILPREIDGTKNGKLQYSSWRKPGLDPFRQGIDGGRPCYWDGKTYLEDVVSAKFFGRQKIPLETSIRNEDPEKLGITKQIQKELDDIIYEGTTPTAERIERLSNYIRHHVLQKHQGADANKNYAYLPGSFMYSLALRFVRNPTPVKWRDPTLVVTAPFISPLVADKYEELNPELEIKKVDS